MRERYISEVVNAKNGVAGIGKGVHKEHGIVIEAMDIGEVEKDVSVAFAGVGTGYLE